MELQEGIVRFERCCSAIPQFSITEIFGTISKRPSILLINYICTITKFLIIEKELCFPIYKSGILEDIKNFSVICVQSVLLSMNNMV